MGSVFSGVGLASGLDINSIVDGLMRIEARPRDLLQARVGTINAQRTAYLEVSARISAMLSRLTSLAQPSAFRTTKATSSNADLLNATTGDGVSPGAYQFVVRALATSHQLVSGGLRDATTPLGGGTLTIESAKAKVNRGSRLDELNGYTGVQRGSFQIVDGDGSAATIRIADAVTLDEVVERINAAGIDVTAAVKDEHLVLTERNGGTIHVRELDNGRTAADLGFAAGANTGTATLNGASLARLSDGSPLLGLNDGRGVRRGTGGGDFRITNSQGRQFSVDLSGILGDTTRLERLNNGRGVQLGQIKITNRQGTARTIDLTGAATIGDVKRAIDAAGANVSVVLNAGRLLISDTTAATSGTLKIEDVGTGTAARDLGIVGNTDTNKIEGRTILSVDTLGDVVRAINFAEGNDGSIRAAIDPTSSQGLSITDSADGTTGRVIFEALNGSSALRDLGFDAADYSSDDPAQGRRIAAGVNTTLLASLNGGRGFTLGTIHIAGASGAADVNLADARTLQDVISKVNAASSAGNLGVEASIDSTGTRLVLANSNGAATPITVTDTSGNFAATTGLNQPAQNGSIRGANLQRQYVNENTKLSELNAGRGISTGKLKVTDSQGHATTVTIPSTASTMRDVLRAINDAVGTGVAVRINDTGDGLLVEDTAGGTGTLKIEEVGGTTAKDLNLLGPATGTKIDGSYELKIDVSAADTLNTVVSRVNSKSSLARATVLNDGSSISPYRLNLSSQQSGAAGELIVDGGSLGLGFSTLSRAADAKVLVGSDASGGVLVTSGTNTIKNVIGGLTLNLTGVSNDPVTVTVDRNYQAVLDALKGFVSDFNTATDRIKQLSDYDQESDKKGPLLGEGTVQTVESRLFRMVTASVGGLGGNLTRLSQIGLKIGDGGDLAFDEEKFKTAFDANPDEVIRFFTEATNGVAAKLKKELDGITQDGGLLKRRDKALVSQSTQLSERIDSLNDILARKRERLLTQFRAMEQAISGLQSQQTALSSIAPISAR